MQYKNRIPLFLVLCLAIAVPYLPTFSGQFILDDHPMVNKNPYIKRFQPFLSYFCQEDGVSAHGKVNDYHSGYYRPLLNITYFLDYKLWGMRATGFRTTNLILHLMTCCLLYLVLSRYYDGIMVALIAALLFGIHPVNSETVSWAAARNNILVSLFSLASFYFYASKRPEKRILSTSLSLLFFAMALFSKEFAVMLLPIFFLHNRLIIDRKLRRRDEWVGYIPYAVILVFYFIVRWKVTQSVLSPGGFESIWQRIYFVPYLIIYNIKLIFFPYKLHSFSVGYPKTLLNWQGAVGFGGVALIGLLLWQSRKERMTLFSVLSFAAGLFPVLNIVKTSAVSLISMRWLYFPMMFLLMGLARYIQKSMKVNQLLTVSVLGAGIVYCGFYSYVLNRNLWHDEDIFFRQEVMGFNNVFYAGGLAENLLDKKRYQEAERYFRIAIHHYPRRAKNYVNYSALLINTGRLDAALSCLDRARSLTMTHRERGEWFNNMGMAYFRLKERNKALEYFLKAVHFHPEEPEFWANLGGAYGSMGDYENSVSALKEGLNIAPDSIQLRKNLAVTYMNMEDYEKAITTLEGIPDPERRKKRDIEGLLRKACNRLLGKDY